MHFALPLLNSCFIAFRAFVPLEAPPSQNSTQWEKVQYLFEELGSSRKYIILPVIFNLGLIFIVVLIMTIGFYFFYLRLIHSFHLTPPSVIFITPLKPRPWLHPFLLSILQTVFSPAPFCYRLSIYLAVIQPHRSV